MEKKQNNDYMDEDYNDNTTEKKTIIYLIIIALILIFLAQFFIHNIVDRGTINKDNSGTINYPDKTDNNNVINNELISRNNNNTTTNTTEPEVVDYSDRIKVKQEGKEEFQTLKELDVFKNYYYNYHDQSIIAPGIKGIYNFTVENETAEDFIYNITFTEENNYDINLEFKIKLNGQYILGDSNTWIKSSELSKTELPLNSKTTDLYTIEWQWPYEGNDELDTQIGGTEGAHYNMKILVVATQVTE